MEELLQGAPVGTGQRKGIGSERSPAEGRSDHSDTSVPAVAEGIYG